MKQGYEILKKESSYKIEKLEKIIENNKKLYEKKILN